MKWIFILFEFVSVERVVNYFREERSEGRSLECRGEDQRFRVTGKGSVGIEDEEFIDYWIQFVKSNEEEVEFSREDSLQALLKLSVLRSWVY